MTIAIHYDLDKVWRKEFLGPIIIVQMIGTKYVQICKVVWAESRIQSTTCLI